MLQPALLGHQVRGCRWFLPLLLLFFFFQESWGPILQASGTQCTADFFAILKFYWFLQKGFEDFFFNKLLVVLIYAFMHSSCVYLYLCFHIFFILILIMRLIFTSNMRYTNKFLPTYEFLEYYPHIKASICNQVLVIRFFKTVITYTINYLNWEFLLRGLPLRH